MPWRKFLLVFVVIWGVAAGLWWSSVQLYLTAYDKGARAGRGEVVVYALEQPLKDWPRPSDFESEKTATDKMTQFQLSLDIEHAFEGRYTAPRK